jgi:hypothetical protein
VEAARTRRVVLRQPVDLPRTLGLLRVAGAADPCVRIGPDGVWRATRTPAGPTTMHLRSDGLWAVTATAWGPGADAALDGVPALVGADDTDGDLLGAHDGHGGRPVGYRVVTDLSRRLAGLRIGRSAAVLETLVPTILAQKVIGAEARSAFVAMVRAARQPAPGPAGLMLPPDAAWLTSTPSWAFHRWGVEHRRASTIKTAAGYAARLEQAAGLPLAEARQRLAALPGVGPWTVNKVALTALGDPDAVSVGDYWLPHIVSWALAGAARGSDERMLELLEPWRGQRGRVCRLLLAGGPEPPRFGPRLPLRSIAQH